jgi:hypothetical protein
MKRIVSKKDTLYVEAILNIKNPVVFFRRNGIKGEPVFMHVFHSADFNIYRCYFMSTSLNSVVEYKSDQYKSRSKAIMETLEKVLQEQDLYVIDLDTEPLQIFINK